MLSALTAYFRTEVCPFCFDPFRLKNTPFRCSSPPSQCAPATDRVYEEKWKVRAPLGKVLESTGTLTGKQRCSDCKQVTLKRLCPNCHSDLPRTMGKYENLIISVIGAKAAGKSHYIAMLVSQILNHVGPNMNLLLEPLSDHTIRRYREDFHDPIFKRKHALEATRSALTDTNVKFPLVYSLARSGKGFLGRSRIRKVVTLAFFDTAGEDLNDQDVMSTVNKYIYWSDGIILLLDPLQLDTVRDRLQATCPLPAQNTEADEIVQRTINLILAGRKLPQGAIIDIPLAVAFSKFDAVLPLVDQQFQLRAQADHSGDFDMADFNAINAEMQALVSQWNGQPLIHQVTKRFKKYAFFGLTSLGCSPNADNTIPRVMPRRVEDPFLWLLYQHKLIRAKRT